LRKRLPPQSLAEIVDECLEIGDRERFLQTFRSTTNFHFRQDESERGCIEAAIFPASSELSRLGNEAKGPPLRDEKIPES
jgi:hypothetical protein